MSKYGQELRVFVISCPSGTVMAQKLLAKINEAADKFDALQRSHDTLIEEIKANTKAMRAGSECITKLIEQRDALLDACEKAQFVYDYVICRTPTGPKREKLTERNILRMQAIAQAKE